MMMVPRSFQHASMAQSRHKYRNEKDAEPARRRLATHSSRPKASVSPPRSPLRTSSDPVTTTTRAAPVQIPSRPTSPSVSRHHSCQTHLSGATITTTPDQERAQISAAEKEREKIDVNSLLAATAIPRRKRGGARPSQRLPRGTNHVADFSKLLLEDVTSTDQGSVAASLTNPHFEALFGHLQEGDASLQLEHEPTLGSLLSSRTLSSDSVPSLGDESIATSFNDTMSPTHSTLHSPPERRVRHFSASQDCADDHPLLYLDDYLDGPPISPPPTDRPSEIHLPTRPMTKSRTSALRSNLTASLRALKSAAQSVSSIAMNPIVPPEDFLTRSVFTFAPELTDDRRPPPFQEQPSAALRRYLNPPPIVSDSAAELHFWQEHPSHSRTTTAKRKGKGSEEDASSPSPAAIPLQTCLPSAVRSPTASSPPIWLSADGQPTNRNTADSLSVGCTIARQREPRENSAFLRVLVAEMNMRRSGKLSEEAESHATMWLPPRRASQQNASSGRDRWVVYPPPSEW